ncbi:tripartite tricarboxylate transporter TctB family protein [Salinicoccus sp. ID82-1]|uniref:tripartite tricarboxylate transporter TctB family protein n=1 Tax=Salinicoccus sp. ID82-1 TaxID=2820269 RepID=UPI001F46AE7F|nr:tripartite tricarboxylate transporter TctB family protein [Salinicoccus sp. ID82-1]MCG1009655.1 tripartite tricarboxylate transporter TctB family protein [Salinicoccus sp. ID82-1]
MLKTNNQRISLVLLAIAGAYLYFTYNLPAYAYTQIDADMVPKGLGWLLVLLSIMLFFARDSETEEQRERRNIPRKEVLALLIVTGMTLLYIFLLEMLGFVLVTALFIFFCSWFLGYRQFITNAVVSIIFPVILYMLFTQFLRIDLPQGLLPF